MTSPISDDPHLAPPADTHGPSVSVRRRPPVLHYALLLGVLAAAAIYIVTTKTKPALIAGPMIQIPSPGKLVVVWEMKSPFSTGVVTLTGADGRTQAITCVPVNDAAPGFLGLCVPDSQRYEAAFTGLEAGAEYSYVVENRGFLGWKHPVAGPYPTRAPLPQNRPFRFLAFGDSGVGSNSQADLALLMVERKPDLIIHAGDLNQIAGEPEDYPVIFFEPYAALIRSIPLLPVLGNHDCFTKRGRPLLDFFVLPDNGPVEAWSERNFYFDFGDARFVGLDVNAVDGEKGGVITAEEMKTTVAPWLRNVLTECDTRWKIVCFHHPIYTGSKHAPDGVAHVKEAYARVLEECGVSLVFNGHNHLYERSAPIREDRVVGEGDGVVYITTGTGGAGRYPMNLPPPFYNRFFCDTSLGFTCVDVTPDRLVLEWIDDRGETRDRYVLETNH